MKADANADWRFALLQQDRCLDLKRPQSGESAQFCYWREKTGLDRFGYKKANHILRDVKYKSTVNMDPRLLDVLFIIQQWLILEGRSSEIHILSGYRTAKHNSTLKGAARNSFHVKAQAADIYIPGISTQLLAAMGRVIGAGGVGIYISNNFVHIDTGNIRIWAN